MRNTITRTITESTINAVTINIVDGQPQITPLVSVTVTGKITTANALKYLHKIHGKRKPITIISIDKSESVYEISVEDFMKHAKKVENPAD